MKHSMMALTCLSCIATPCVALDLVDAYSGEADELTHDTLWWQDLQKSAREGASLDELSDRVLLRMAASDDAVCDVQSAGLGEHYVMSIRRGYHEAMVVDGPSPAVNQALARQLQPWQGRIVRKSELADLLDWLHRNPFHAVAPTFAPSSSEGGVDSLWQAAPVRRWRANLGANNQGVAPLTRERFFVDATLGDFAGHSSVMSLQWVTALDPNEFSSLRWDTTMYLPWRHEWRTSFSWTGISFLDDCSCEVPQQIDGQTWQASGKYVIAGEELSGWSQDKHVALYYRSTDNALEAGDTVSTGLVDSVFFGIGWNLWKKRERSESRIACELLISPGDIGGNNDQADHETFRAGAENDYIMLRSTLQHVRGLKGDWRWAAYATTQLASAPVLPHDQMALGGMNAVRALPENSLLGDQVIRYGSEVRSGSWKIKAVPCELAASVYFDGGLAHNSEEHSTESEHSLGLGLHLSAMDHLHAELSQAWALGGESTCYASLRLNF